MSNATLRPATPPRSDDGLLALEKDARALLSWAIDEFERERFALVSAFGPGSSVLFHLLAGIGRDLPVIFIDTLHHFPETLQHVDRVRALYGLDLRVHRPAPDLATFERLHGPRLWEHDLERYQRASKVEPFLAATRGLDGWITGRRRDQGPSRASLSAVQGIAPMLVNPLAGWSRGDVWQFIRSRGLPYNPLHDLGYSSIGDAPLTLPVPAGEDERAGRWRGTGRLECGIHTREWRP